MNSEFARFVADAASIKTSGRWTAMNAKIERMAASPGEGNDWYVQLFASLCFQIFSEYLALKTTYDAKQDRDASLLAWRARNLLELSVWSIYFTRTKENARRLYEDAGRDAHEIFSAFENWGQTAALSADWLTQVQIGKQDLTRRAAAEGVEELQGAYKRVDVAARDCGIGDSYRLNCKMLSKFAHPTAMQILGTPDAAKHALQRDCFFGLGCLFFTGAFNALEGVSL
ncbi:MAG TPA: hypothetical protein VHU23_11915 [Rhizomicrobium sp.]|jgi:hypothetical protein|nr:hypothetical protein [Rhizomicrobium sp.]